MNWSGKAEAFKHDALNIPGVENASLATWYPEIGGGAYMTWMPMTPLKKVIN